MNVLDNRLSQIKLPNVLQENFYSFFYFHPGSYLDLFNDSNNSSQFSRDRIVYISPYANEPLLHYSPDDIYIIGGLSLLLDRNISPMSMINAQRANIRCVRLPLDEMVRWSYGRKHLKLYKIRNILQTVADFSNNQSNYNIWKEAIEKHCFNNIK